MTQTTAPAPDKSKSLYDWRYAGLAVYSAIMRGESEIIVCGPRGCIAPWSVVDGSRMTIEQQARKGIAPVVRTMRGLRQAKIPFWMGVEPLYRVRLRSSQEFVATAEHRIAASSAWRPIHQLSPGMELHSTRYATNDSWDHMVHVDLIESISYVGTHDYFDLHVPELEHYAMSGAWHHNTGKTMFMADMCFRFGMKYAGMTQKWVRKYREDMTDSVLTTFETEVLPGYPGMQFSGPNRSTRKGYDLPRGSNIVVDGIHEIASLKSKQADLWWVNECSEVPEGHWEEIGGTSRATKYGTCPFRVKIGDTNPMPPSHWTNTRCAPVPDHLYPRVTDDGTRFNQWFTPEMYAEVIKYNLQPLGRYQTRKILFFHVENPGYWNDQTYDWHPNGIEYIRTKLSPMKGSRRARYLEGRPAAEEDVVFPEFSRKDHVIKRFDWPADWPVWCAYDPGYRHPCAVDFVGIAPDGQPFFIDEIHAAGINIDKLGPLIQQKAAKYRIVKWLADPNGADQRTQISNGETAMHYMARSFGLHFQPWKMKRGKVVQDHVELLRHWLVMPDPIQIFDDCPGIISNFESWMNKQTASGELPEGDERYVDLNNDGIDGLLGIVADDPSHEVAPSVSFSHQKLIR